MVKVFGYDTDDIPTMDDAIQLWQKHGRVVFQEGQNSNNGSSKQQRPHVSMTSLSVWAGAGSAVVILGLCALIYS